MIDVLIAANRADGESAFARFRKSLAYDALTRLPLVLWFAICGSAMVQRLMADLAAAVDATLVLDTIARSSSIAFILFVILALMVRRPAIARAPGLPPRLVAFGGAFSISTLALLPPVAHSPAVSVVSMVFMLGGYVFACYAVMHLGRSLSLMAEARKLVMTGPYGWVRHPLYAAEAVASMGVLLQYLSPAAVVLWMMHISLQLCRMRYEERVLRDTFVEYGDYARRVARLMPGVY